MQVVKHAESSKAGSSSSMVLALTLIELWASITVISVPVSPCARLFSADPKVRTYKISPNSILLGFSLTSRKL